MKHSVKVLVLSWKRKEDNNENSGVRTEKLWEIQ